MKNILALATLVLAVSVLAPPSFAADDPGKLLEAKTSINFAETPFNEVIAFISVWSGVDMTIDPTLDSTLPVTLALKDTTARNALELVVALASPNLKWDFRWGGVFIAMKNRLEFLPKEVPGDAPGLDKAVNVDFAETALPEVVQFLGSFSGARIVITPVAMPRAKETMVSIRCNHATLRDALCRIVFPANLAWEIKDGVVRVLPAQTKRMESPEDAARRALKETKVNVNFEDTSLREVANFFSQYAGVGIYLDPMLPDQFSENELLVTTKADDITLANALELICLLKNLNYDFRWGGVFIAHPDRLKVLTKAVMAEPAEDLPDWEIELRKQLEDGITFSFDGATADQALDFVRTLKGVNIVLTPQALKKASTAEISQTVNDISLANALALILVPHGLTFELKNEVVLISVPK